MTKLSIFMYVADVIESISKLFGATIFVLLLGLTIIIFYDVMVLIDSGDELMPKVKKTWFPVGIVIIFLSMIACLTPSKKTLYTIAGIEFVNEFSQSDAAKKTSGELVDLVKDVKKIVHDYATGEDK